MAKAPRYRFTYNVRRRYAGFDSRDSEIEVSVIAEKQANAERKAIEVTKAEFGFSYKYNAELLKIEEVA